MLISVNKLVNGVMYINLSVSTGIPRHGKISVQWLILYSIRTQITQWRIQIYLVLRMQGAGVWKSENDKK